MGPLTLRSDKNDHRTRYLRKLHRRLAFFKNVQDTVAEKNQPKKKITKTKKRLLSRKKKLKAYDLSALSEFLPDLETLATTKSDVTKEEKINCKSRQTLVQKESARMQSVLQDPSFMKDPFEAIHKQLLETQPPEQEEYKSPWGGKKKERRKRGKKAKSGARDMEI